MKLHHAVHACDSPRPAAQQAIELKGGPHAVLLFDGPQSSPHELGFLAWGLHRAGHTVRMPGISGYSHGLTDAPWRSADDWLDDALLELDTLLDRFDQVSLGGLGTGAMLALRLAAMRPVQVRHLMCLSSTRTSDGSDPSWRKRWHAWRQVRALGAIAHRSLSNVRSPLLLVHDREGQRATPLGVFDVANRVRSARVRLALIDDGHRKVSTDSDQHPVLQEMLQFLAPTVSGAPGVRPADPPQALPLFQPRTASQP